MGVLEISFDFNGKRFADAQKGVQALGTAVGKSIQPLSLIVRKELESFTKTVGAALAKRHSSAWSAGTRLPAGDRTGKLARRSGTLQQALQNLGTVEGSEIEDLQVTLSIPEPYGIHEFGGRVRAKRAKYLTIPLPAALDSSGVPLKRKARDWQNTFVAKTKKGNLMIFQRRGKEVVPLYLLRKEVMIPQRLGLKVTAETALPFFAERAIDRMVKELLK